MNEELKNKLMQKDEVNAFFNTPIEGWSSDPCAICESKNEYPRYKQELRDKTTECEELKEQLEKNRKLTLEYISSGEKYHQTCLDLKEELKEYEDILDSRQREWEEENERYIQALDEIENYCNKYGQNSIGFRKNILDIIKKLRDGEE